MQLKKLFIEKVNQKIAIILALNKEIKRFLEIELPEYTKKIFPSHKINSKDPLTEGEILAIFKLGTRCHEFLEYQRYHEDLRNDQEFQRFLEVIYSWNVEYVVRQKVELIKLLYPLFKSIDLNALLLKHTNKRLIDLAVDKKAFEIVVYLIEQGVDATFFYDKQKEDRNSHFNIHHHANFPLMEALERWQTNAKLLFNHPPAYYDALAWCIDQKDEHTFKRIVEESDIKLVVEQKISAGHFSGFTLLQLLVFYERTGLFLEKTSEFEIEKWKQLATEVYPLKYANEDNFEYGNWSLLEVAIYQGNYDLLRIMCDKGGIDLKIIPLRNPKNYGFLQLLIEGASKRSFDSNYSYFEEKKDLRKTQLKKFSQCLAYILAALNMSSLPNLYFLDENGNAIPLLHFAILHDIYSLIKGKFELDASKLEESVWVEKVQEKVNCLQLSVLRLGDISNHIYQFYQPELSSSSHSEVFSPLSAETTASTLTTNTHTAVEELGSPVFQQLNLLNIVLAPLKNHHGINLFQYSLVYEEALPFLNRIIRWESCPVNKEFPSDHPNYPNWLPIHFVLERAFFGNQKCYILMRRPDLDLTKPFPENGRSNLTGFYPLSAIFYSGNPRKNDQFSLRSFVNLSKEIMEHILKSKISPKQKKDILTQALYYAVIYHDVNRQHDHSKSISLLLNAGADPYRNLSSGYRIIEIAYDKGLIHLFNNFMNDSEKLRKREFVTLVKNERPSEMNSVTEQSYIVSENRYAVVSLVRNVTSDIPDHVFLIIELVLRGQAQTHFIDFVQDTDCKNGMGKIRHYPVTNNIKTSLIHECKLTLMKIEAMKDIVVKPWLLPIEACEQLLASVELDKNKDIPYAVYGDRSLLGSISGKGESCYSWARKHLLTTKDPHIEKQLRPTFEEWLVTFPRLKLPKNEVPWLSLSRVNTFFRTDQAKNVGIGLALAAAVALIGAYNYQNS